MNNEIFITQVDLLLSKNRVGEAIKACFIQASECYDQELKDAVVNISQSYTQNEEQNINNLITPDTYEDQTNKIVDDIQTFIKKLEAFLLNNEIDKTGEATYTLRKIVNNLRGNQLLLNNNQLFLEDIKAVLFEIKKSYQLILKFINGFSLPLLSSPLDFTFYQNVSTNGLYQEMDNGRGRCHIIFDHYNTKIRPAIQNMQISDSLEFNELDQIFSQLGDGDNTIFDQIIEVGNYLTTQSESIIDTLIDSGEEKARALILQGRKKLKTLQQELQEANAEILDLELLLGHTI